MNPQTWWFLSRASGMTAGILLVLSLIWGVLLSTRVLKPADRPAWLLAMHRWFAGMAVTATAVHLIALVADNYVYFGAKELFVPMSSPWKAGPVAFGIVAFYLMVLVQATSLMMRRLPKRLWRAIHMSSYAMVWLVLVHGALAGTDATMRVYQVVALILIISAVTAAMLRVNLGRHRDATTRSPKPTKAVTP
jgi:DMSO/TMAO reductase YedYZ heme-binding membrane subunit